MGISPLHSYIKLVPALHRLAFSSDAVIFYGCRPQSLLKISLTDVKPFVKTICTFLTLHTIAILRA